MSDINRNPIDRDEKGKQIHNVQGVTFKQDPNNNTDVQSTIELYYTDLDPSYNAELFTGAGEAFIKAEQMLHKFPSHIVKFYMFYYTERYDISGKLIGVKKELCQVVPGVPIEDSQVSLLELSAEKARDYRAVNRKSLKSIYDKIDFIQIYRPLNGIKWYTVSKEDLNTELAVIRDFYGLTNFPDKVGNYYFSKKIGKWLASKELTSILEWYRKNDLQIPVIYPDVIVDGYQQAERKSLLQILWDWIVEIFKGFGNFIGKVLGNLFDPEKWEEFWADEDNNYIPDSIDDLWKRLFKWTNDENESIFNVGSLPGDTEFTNEYDIFDYIRGLLGGDANMGIAERLKAVWDKLNNYKFDLSNGILLSIQAKFDDITNSLKQDKDGLGFTETIWNNFVEWIKDKLNLNFNESDDDNNA